MLTSSHPRACRHAFSRAKRKGTILAALLVTFFAKGACCPLFAASIRGHVAGTSGESLARVQISVLEPRLQATTDEQGQFTIAGLAAGNYTLQANAVGYWLINIRFSLAEGESTKSFDITLTPDNSTPSSTVKVNGDLFQGTDSPAIVKENLTPEEIRETSTVLADDPFRSIQALPGVSAAGNDDFLAQFSVMGAQYQNVGIYIDDIYVPAPFHGVEITATEGATLSIFTTDTLRNVNLMPAAYPEKYGDDVGAALTLQTRDGSRIAPVYRIAAGLADSEADGEGPLGHRTRGSWLASGRKSYLGWLFLSRLNDTSYDAEFYDADLKLDYNLTPNQRVDFYGVGGPTTYRLVHPSTPPGTDGIDSVTDNFILGRVGWSWAVDPRLFVEAHGAHFQQPNHDSNVDGQPLDDSHYAEWVAAGSVVSGWHKDQVLEGGWMGRRASADTRTFSYSSLFPVRQSGEQAEGWKNDGYAQQSSSLFGNRLHLVGGVRIDTAALFDAHPLSPQLSAAWLIRSTTQVQLGFGRYHQFGFPAYTNPDFGTGCSIRGESLQAADHYTAALDQRISPSTRLQFLLFDRNDTGYGNESVIGACPPGLATNGFQTFSRDYSRGAQIVLQSRDANRLSGWIGYTLAYARESYYSFAPNSVAYWSAYFPTLADQRNTLNVFANYRLTPTLNLGGKFLYGSGYPVPDGEFNPTRLGDDQRLDLRAEKDWTFRQWKLATYGELLNTTNHYNPIYFYTSYIGNAGTVVTGQGLPITPTAGVAFEF